MEYIKVVAKSTLGAAVQSVALCKATLYRVLRCFKFSNGFVIVLVGNREIVPKC